MAEPEGSLDVDFHGFLLRGHGGHRGAAGQRRGAAGAAGARCVVGFEANGGFLLGSDIERGGRVLPALPTRDAILVHLGVLTSAQLWDPEPGSIVQVAGVVTHRQRPMTAQGVTFLNLEDETGLINVVVSKGCWARFRRVAREAPALMVRGRLERSEGVVNIVAEHLAPLPMPANDNLTSRSFR